MSLSGQTDLRFNIAASVLSVIAVQWGMKRNLETQSAIQRVVPPAESDAKLEAQVAETQVPKARTGCARFIPNRRQWKMLGQYAVFGLIAYFVPRYGSTLILDVLFGGFWLWLLSSIYRRAIDSLFPIPTQLRYVRPGNPKMEIWALQEKEADGISTLQENTSRKIMGFLCASLTLLGAAQGYKAATLLAPPAVILSMMPVFVGPSVSMRAVTYLLMVFQLLPVIVVPGVVLYQRLHPKADGPPQNSGERIQPSAWVLDLGITVNGWLLSAVAPTGLICLTNRFEHFSRTSLPPTPTEPGATLLIKRGRAFLAESTLTSAASIGLLSYAAGLAFYVYLINVYRDDNQALGNVMGGGMFIMITTTMLGIMGAVLLRGRWAEWWGYYEQWAKREIGDKSDH